MRSRSVCVALASLVFAALAIIGLPLLAQSPVVEFWSPTGGVAGEDEVVPERVLGRPAGFSASAEAATLSEWTVPAYPVNVMPGSDGAIWFSHFSPTREGPSAIGRLDTVSGTVTIYSGQTRGDTWALHEDADGNVWYGVVNDKRVGRLDPETGIMTEWAVRGKTQYGLDIDADTGDVWFTSQNTAEISRLSPGTGEITIWSTLPYPNPYDLQLAPDGSVWFTMQPSATEAIGRLDPDTDAVTLWQMPTPDSRPFRIMARSTDEIWVTEMTVERNTIARLTPSSNTLHEYSLSPLAKVSPSGLAVDSDGALWYSGRGGDVIGQLSPVAPIDTVIAPVHLTATRGLTTVVPISFDAVVPTTPATAAEKTVSARQAGSVTEYAVSAGTDPWGVAYDPATDNLWFAGYAGQRLGRIDLSAEITYSVLVPAVLRGD